MEPTEDEVIARLERDAEAFQRGCETLDYDGALKRLGLDDDAPGETEGRRS